MVGHIDQALHTNGPRRTLVSCLSFFPLPPPLSVRSDSSLVVLTCFITPALFSGAKLLLTGNGNDNGGTAPFLEAVNRALRMGWMVEVWSWRASCSKNYKGLQELYGGTGRFKLFFLDDFPEVFPCACFLPTNRGQEP